MIRFFAQSPAKQGSTTERICVEFANFKDDPQTIGLKMHETTPTRICLILQTFEFLLSVKRFACILGKALY